MSARLSTILGCVVGGALPAAVAAQGLQFTVGGVAAQEIVQSHVDSANDRFSGLMLGFDGAMVSNRFVVRLHYAEGRITPKSASGSSGVAGLLGSASTDPRDVVEGEALVGFRAVPWLTLWAGPTARAYTVGDNDQRWLIWSGRAAARGTLIPGRMQTFVELWGALSGKVDNPALKARGRGASAGLEMRFGEASSFWGRLGYAIQSTHADGLRETVEALTLSVMYGFPQ